MTDRVVVRSTVREYVKQGGSRPFVVMLDGNRIGDFDTEAEAEDTRRDVMCSLGLTVTLQGRFEQLGILHAKLGAEYGAMAKEIAQDAERTEDAPTTPESIGDAATESTP